jgi:hypothetical protein
MRPVPPGFDPQIWASLEAARQHVQAGEIAPAMAIYERERDLAIDRADHFNAMVVAHTAGAAEADPDKKHRWNLIALEQADLIKDVVGARGMYPSLYNNLGLTHALRGDSVQARRCYQLALSHLASGAPGTQEDQMRAAIERNVARLDYREDR